MTFTSVVRPIALALAMSALAAGTAAAQTVVLRGIPAGSAAEAVVTGVPGAAAATLRGTADANGDAVLTGGPVTTDLRVNIFADACDAVHRVVIAERDTPPPPAADGCTRSAIPGLFVIRSVSSVVVRFGGTSPTVLLRQGEFDLSPPRVWNASPTGLIVHGGGGFSNLSRARIVACGDITECPGDDTGGSFTGGVAYWLTPFFGVEASYMKGNRTLAEGAIGNSLFRSSTEPQAVSFVGRLGAPLGPVRLYGQGGAAFTRAAISNVQDSLDGLEDRYDLHTSGWGWTIGGGLEGWVAPAAALYVELGRTALKGKGVDTAGEGLIDDKMNYIVFGLRVRVTR